MNITFSDSVMTGYLVSGAAAILLTLIFVLVWKIKTKAALIPMLVGAATFMIFAEGLKAVPALPLLSGTNAVSQKILSTPWLYYLVAGLLAGIFEETGRLAAFRFVLKKHRTRKTALDYGVGHGGVEAVFTSISYLATAMLGKLVNSGMLDAQMQSMPDALKEYYMKQLADRANVTFGQLMLWLPERTNAIMFHIAMSVFVFCAVREKKPMLFFAAVVLHTLLDFGCVLYQPHPVLTEILLFAFAVVMLVIAIRVIYRRLPEEQEVQT